MENQASMSKGVKMGLPIAMGYIPIGITYGLIAKAQGLPLWFILILSLTTFAGSSQFIAVQLMAAGAGALEVIVTTFAVNFRNFLMSSAVSLRGPAQYSKFKKLATAMTVTDETFAVVSSYPVEKVPFRYIVGLHGVLYLAWNGATLLGAAVVSELGAVWNNSLGIAIYAMFISMLIPLVKKSNTTLRVGVITAVVSMGLYQLGIHKIVGNSSVLLISAVAGAFAGAVMSKGGAVHE